MKFFNSIPRGLLIFLGVIVVIVLIALSYRLFFGGSASSTSDTARDDAFSSLFPFGSGNTPGSSVSAGTTTPLLNEISGNIPVLRQISAEPVAGAWFSKGPTATSSARIRFANRATGHVSETPTDSLTQTRITNTTIPGIQELYAVSDSTIIVRSLNDSGGVQNFYGIVNATSSQQSLTLVPLKDFSGVAVGAGGANILTVTKTSSGSRVELSKPDSSKSQTLLTSAIASWVPLMGGTRTFLETAPTAAANGYLYELAGSALVKIAGGLPGLTATIAPSGKYVAISSNAGSGFSFSIIDTKNGTVYANPAHALALKCAWIPGKEPLLFCAIPTNPPQSAYPDEWLLGNISFSDEAWIVNPLKHTQYFIGPLTDEAGVPIDAENVSVDQSGSYALFMNKNDLTLWSLNIRDAISKAQMF